MEPWNYLAIYIVVPSARRITPRDIALQNLFIDQNGNME